MGSQPTVSGGLRNFASVAGKPEDLQRFHEHPAGISDQLRHLIGWQDRQLLQAPMVRTQAQLVKDLQGLLAKRSLE